VYGGKPIVHSVGNFMLMPPSTGTPDIEAPSHEGLIARATIAARRVKRLELIPIAIGPDGVPQIAGNGRAERILATVSGLSAQYGARLTKRNGFSELVLD
jgi:poly-gamma-glutamate capsule biosynthesis protein CapA/YwtB (metallophosphatase superfamily)